MYAKTPTDGSESNSPAKTGSAARYAGENGNQDGTGNRKQGEALTVAAVANLPWDTDLASWVRDVDAALYGKLQPWGWCRRDRSKAGPLP